MAARARTVQARGGYREDLGLYVRSRWEANYARYLEWLRQRGEIRDWEYEPCEFVFPVKRGTRFYRPDFRVIEKGGQVTYHEVKGYMDQKSRTALKRMARYYPKVRIVIVGRSEYREIEKWARLIPGWESD
ncbi:MAG: hypothetical protein AB7E55_01340 [Pigmentiphaga sp.]